jgi:hypothetical protein
MDITAENFDVPHAGYRKWRNSMNSGSNAPEIDIAEIKEVSITDPNAVRLRLVARDRREWILNLPLKVLDLCLHQVSADRVLELRAETESDHARLTYPKKAWRLFQSETSPEPTFSCLSDDGCGFEIGFNIDPLKATPTLAVTVAAG